MSVDVYVQIDNVVSRSNMFIFFDGIYNDWQVVINFDTPAASGAIVLCRKYSPPTNSTVSKL